MEPCRPLSKSNSPRQVLANAAAFNAICLYTAHCFAILGGWSEREGDPMPEKNSESTTGGNLPSSQTPPGGWAVAGVVTSVLAFVWVIGAILTYGHVTQRFIDWSFGLSAYVQDQVLNSAKLQQYLNDEIEKQVSNNARLRHQLATDIDAELTSEAARGTILAFVRKNLPSGYSGY